MPKKNGSASGGLDKKHASTAAPSGRPLNSLHQDEGWTPEGLDAELEAQGIDPEEEAKKLRALLPDAMVQAAASRRAALSFPGARMGDFEVLDALAKPLPVMAQAVAAGKPEWAQMSSEDKRASAFELLGAAPTADCAWARVSGMAMRDDGIVDGCFVLVDKARQAAPGDIILGELPGHGHVVRRLSIVGGDTVLRSANPSFPDIVVATGKDLAIHGVVVGSIQKIG